nr:FAR1 DNA binding domain-containing protein [Tanacetum cinerariifolium]
MADRTLEELLQAPSKGYGEAIVIPEILAENFEIKTSKRICFKLTQIDTFYNGLTEKDQNSLNAASGGNLLNKTTREALQIIENKSKVRYSRSRTNIARVNTNSRDVVSKTDDRIDKLADQISNLVHIINKQVVAPAKAVEKVCVTCGRAHAYSECIATDSEASIPRDVIETGEGLISRDVFDMYHNESYRYDPDFAPTPNGTSYWRPDLPEDEKPKMGDIFDTFDDGYNMYKVYSQK